MLAPQVEHFAPRQRISRRGVMDGQASVRLSGKVQVIRIDADQEEVVVDDSMPRQLFGFASVLEQAAHPTGAIALEQTECLESRATISPSGSCEKPKPAWTC